MRRRAKTINFAILYGISRFGLAAQLGIPKQEAGDDRQLFRALPRHPRLHGRHQEARTRARLRGNDLRPAHPLSGDQYQEPVHARLSRARGDQRADPGLRRRHHPPRHDPHARRLQEAGLNSVRMLLQVHDELVFEAKAAEVEKALPIIRRVMEKAASRPSTSSSPCTWTPKPPTIGKRHISWRRGDARKTKRAGTDGPARSQGDACAPRGCSNSNSTLSGTFPSCRRPPAWR